jgi:hypothetical protein
MFLHLTNCFGQVDWVAGRLAEMERAAAAAAAEKAAATAEADQGARGAARSNGDFLRRLRVGQVPETRRGSRPRANEHRQTVGQWQRKAMTDMQTTDAQTSGQTERRR